MDEGRGGLPGHSPSGRRFFSPFLSTPSSPAVGDDDGGVDTSRAGLDLALSCSVTFAQYLLKDSTLCAGSH